MSEITIDMTSKFAYFWFVGPKDDFMVSCQFPFFLQHLNSSHVWRWCERTHTHTRTHWIIYSGVRTYTFLVWTSECFPVTVTLFEIPLIHFSFQTRSNFSCTSLKMLQPLLSLCWSQWKLSFTAGAAHEIFFFFSFCCLNAENCFLCDYAREAKLWWWHLGEVRPDWSYAAVWASSCGAPRPKPGIFSGGTSGSEDWQVS